MILRAMETVVSNHISELDKDMAKAVILLASSEMTKVKVRGVPAKPPSAPGLPDLAMAQGLLSQAFLPQHVRMWVCVWLPWDPPLSPAH